MIGKVMAGGRGVGGLLRYVTQERDAAHALTAYVTGDQHELGAVAYRNVLAENAADAAREMALTARLSARCAKPFLHVQLAWHPEERPADGQIIAAMDRTLARLGLEDRQAVYAIHLEKAHVHVHAVVNRVGADGRAWRDFRSAERFIEASRAVERELGFLDREQQIARARAAGRGRAVRSTAQQQRIGERSGVAFEESYAARLVAGRARAAAFAARIGPVAKVVLRSAQRWAGAHDGLAQHGLGLVAFANPKTPARKGLELVELATGQRCAASELGSDYGRAQLEKRLGAFVAGPENARLEALGRVETAQPARTPAPGRLGPSAGRETRPAAPRADVQTALSAHMAPAQRHADAGARTDASLWREYQAERVSRSAERAQAFDRQRAHERARREALRAERARAEERLRAGGLRGAAWKALRSELAFAAAKARAVLDATIASERAELGRASGARTWTAFVNERAAAGDGRAIAQLACWNRSGDRALAPAFAIEQPRDGRARSTPEARTLTALQYAVNGRTGDVTYRWERDGRVAFTDYGSTIALADGGDRAAIRAALELAREKWGTAVQLRGDEAFQRAATEIATELRLTITNPELRAYQQQLVAQRAAVERERAAERDREAQREREREIARERLEQEREREAAALRERAWLLDGRALAALSALRPGLYDAQLVGVAGEVAIVAIGERCFAFRAEEVQEFAAGDAFAVRLEVTDDRRTSTLGDRDELEAEIHREHEREAEQEIDRDYDRDYGGMGM